MPIRVRLALWYGAIFGVALAVFGLLLYILMAQHFERMVNDAVTTRLSHLAAAVHADNPSGASGQPLRIPPLDTFETPEVYVQVLDAGGRVIARSSNLEGQTLPAPTGGLANAPVPLSLGGVRLKSAMVPVIVGDHTVAWVQVAASYQQRDQVLERLRWALALGGIGAIVVVGLLSSALAGGALRPISEMTETARAIAVSRGFSRRLTGGNASDELGQLAQTFNEMLASLEEAYSAQQRFTADASHELRAPLTAILGNLDLLERIKDMPEDERRETLRRVRAEVERLSRLVQDLLTLARADSGQALRIGPVELDALLVEAHRQGRAMANGRDLRLERLEPVVVQGDEDRLRQLLFILLDNAIRYTPSGGTVTLWLRREPPWVTVGVEDTGIGIDPEDLPHIFERFWRADRARSRDSGGTGLGLAIAKWIADQHGGEIAVDSAPGKGTRFRVRLPAPTA